jgi:glycine betaine/proline transport system substrate-binding protein
MWKHTSGLVAAVALAFGASGSAQAAGDTVRIGWTAWSDAEFVTKLANRILEDRMDQDVELVQTDIAPQYQGVASGDIDVMLMSWQPGTHADYIDKVGDKIVNLGQLYDHARLGWVVPSYVPEDQLSSIPDLKQDAVREKLDGTITGIDPGAGLTRLSKEAVKEYNLDDYDLQISSGAGMTASVKRAVENDEWIVATGWSPHWMFGRWDLRYLEDPKNVLGSFEHIDAVAREGFYQDNIEAATMLSRMRIPLKDLQASMYEARQTSYDEAVQNFLDDNEKRVEYWVTGNM